METHDFRPSVKKADVDPATYRKALHQFMQVAAKGSVAHAPIIRHMLLENLKRNQQKVRDLVIHEFEANGGESFTDDQRIKFSRLGVKLKKGPISQKDFWKLIALIEDVTAAEQRMFAPVITARKALTPEEMAKMGINLPAGATQDVQL